MLEFVAQDQVGVYVAVVAVLALMVTGLGVYLRKRMPGGGEVPADER